LPATHKSKLPLACPLPVACPLLGLCSACLLPALPLALPLACPLLAPCSPLAYSLLAPCLLLACPLLDLLDLLASCSGFLTRGAQGCHHVTEPLVPGSQLMQRRR
jgi:hypothetical protein